MNNIVIAFSLNPKHIVKKYEDKTPSLTQRIKAIVELQKLGWNIGLRFDPLIIDNPNNFKIYDFFKFVFNKIDTRCLNNFLKFSF